MIMTFLIFRVSLQCQITHPLFAAVGGHKITGRNILLSALLWPLPGAPSNQHGCWSRIPLANKLRPLYCQWMARFLIFVYRHGVEYKEKDLMDVSALDALYSSWWLGNNYPKKKLAAYTCRVSTVAYAAKGRQVAVIAPLTASLVHRVPRLQEHRGYLRGFYLFVRLFFKIYPDHRPRLESIILSMRVLQCTGHPKHQGQSGLLVFFKKKLDYVSNKHFTKSPIPTIRVKVFFL